MKQWELLPIQEDGSIDYDGEFYHFTSHNPVKFAKKCISLHCLKHGYIFRQYKKRPYGLQYMEGKWYKISNGKKMEVFENRFEVEKDDN